MSHKSNLTASWRTNKEFWRQSSASEKLFNTWKTWSAFLCVILCFFLYSCESLERLNLLDWRHTDRFCKTHHWLTHLGCIWIHYYVLHINSSYIFIHCNQSPPVSQCCRGCAWRWTLSPCPPRPSGGLNLTWTYVFNFNSSLSAPPLPPTPRWPGGRGGGLAGWGRRVAWEAAFHVRIICAK